MHQRKLAAKPRRNLTPEEQSQSRFYDHCKCGGMKARVSSHCRNCRVQAGKTKVSEKVFYVDGKPCRYIPLTQGQKVTVLSERYDSLSKWEWHAVSKRGGFYAARTEGDRTIYMHCQIVSVQCEEVDHKNHDTLDNRDSNLRPCSFQQNRANTFVRAKTKSGFKGVYPNPKGKPWKVIIDHNRVSTYFGSFDDAREAARVYDRAAIRYFGEFAHTNFPVTDYAD